MKANEACRGWVVAVSVAAVIAAGAWSQAQAATTMPYVRTFELWPLGAHWSVGASTTQQKIGGCLGGGNGVSVKGILTLDIDASSAYQNSWFQVYAKPLRANGFPSDTGWTGVSGAFYVANDGTLWASAGDEPGVLPNTWTQVGTAILPTDQWIGFAVHMDHVNKKYTIFHRTTSGMGEPFIRDGEVNMRGGMSPVFTGVQLGTLGTVAGLFDEVAVSPGPAGAARPEYAGITVRHTETRTPGVQTLYRVPVNEYANKTLAGFIGDDLTGGLVPGDLAWVICNNGSSDFWGSYSLLSDGTWNREGSTPFASTLQLMAGQALWIEAGVARTNTGFYSTLKDPLGIPAQSTPPVGTPLPLKGTVTESGWTHLVWTYADVDLQQKLNNVTVDADFGDYDRCYVMSLDGRTSDRRVWNGTAWAKSGVVSPYMVTKGQAVWIKRVGVNKSTTQWYPFGRL